MRRFSAQYIFTNTGPPLKRGIITTSDDGTILSVSDTSGELPEKDSLEFHNGIIIPGLVNCHCHLELSHMKGMIPSGNGLAEFLNLFRTGREADEELVTRSASAMDSEMFRSGTVLCADICNSDITFGIKKESKIKYISLLEVFGIDPEKATRRIEYIRKVADRAESMRLSYSIVPHAVYSISPELFRLILSVTSSNLITSMHFMETRAEKRFLEFHDGPLMDSYIESELITGIPKTVKDHVSAVLEEVTQSGNLILVHNTFADRSSVSKIKKRGNVFWCLCPNANLYIEQHLPPVKMLKEEKCTIVIGTDSLASNNRLNILEEMKTLLTHFPDLTLEEVVLWSTFNGAVALGEEGSFGSIQPGMKPGLLLLQDVDLQKMSLLPESSVIRLI